jgi:transmembrane 9 superfamily protein 2/4
MNVFRKHEFVPLYHNKIFSDSSALQYAYADLPFVCPTDGYAHMMAGIASGSSITLNLGEILRGDRISLSDYDLYMGSDREMQPVCTIPIDERILYRMQSLIRDNYKVDWVIDDLPAGSVYMSTDGLRKYYSAGFPIGHQEIDRTTMESKYYVHNHVSMVVRYRSAGYLGYEPVMAVTGFEAYPKSIQYGDWKVTSNTTFDANQSTPRLELTMPENPSQTLDIKHAEAANQFSIPYTYSVYYVEEDDENIGWTNRWDRYLDDQEQPRLSLATTNAVIVALLANLLAAVVTRPVLGILYAQHIRVLRRLGIQRLWRSSSADLNPAEAASKGEMAPWKLIYRDVFRVPPYAPLLAPLMGSGMQLLYMVLGMQVLAGTGFFAPNSDGPISFFPIAMFVVGCWTSGGYSAMLYKSLGGHLWRFNIVITGIMIPGLLFTTIFIINLFVWFQAASTALPFGTFISLFAIWLGFQLPLVYLGGLYGHKRWKTRHCPIEPSSIPRRIPQQPWYLRKPLFVLLAGFIPFQIILIEQIYVFNGLLPTRNIFYQTVGVWGLIHWAAIFLGLCTTVGSIATIGTWLQLSSEVCSRLIPMSLLIP